MKFPYGISNFYKLITEGYFYVDRTDRIPLIEEGGPRLLFLRPRRFGKNLLLSMLEHYYDVAQMALGFERLVWEEVSRCPPGPQLTTVSSFI